MTRMRKLSLVAAVVVVAATAVYLLACGAVQRPDGGEGMLEEGAAAPVLEGVDQDGQTRSIAEARGNWLVVYFYPKDGTPGCTKEACAFRDAWDRFREKGVLIYGVSADDQESHREFAAEHEIPFPLIADPDKRWATAFGVGTFLGMTERVSFLVGPDGRVAKTYPDVDPGVHAADLLKDVARLSAGD